MTQIVVNSLDELVALKTRSKGVTRKDLAQKAGMSENTFSSKVKGNSDFTLSEAICLSEWLDVPLKDFCSLVYPDYSTRS